MIDIRLETISKTYGQGRWAATAVDNVTLEVGPGELFFLLGPSGCGKTTLLRIIAGLVDPTAGRVWLGGRDITAMPPERRDTAMVFQNYALWPHMTVAQNVQFGPQMKGLPAAERGRRVLENLRRVEMEPFSRRKPNQLSGGQQQRVALARALAAGSRCLLLDEPLSNLDARLRLQMRGVLRRLIKESGTTALYVTHDQKEAMSMADRVAVMHAGRVEQVGTPVELYERPATRFVAEFVGEANCIPGRVLGVGERARVQTALGTIISAATAPGSGEVTCCIRPERLRMAPVAGGAGENEFPASVEAVTYQGESVQYFCRMADGSTWKVQALGGAEFAPAVGAAVSLAVEPRHVALLLK